MRSGIELRLREAEDAGYVHVAPRVTPVRSARVIAEVVRNELRHHASGVRITRSERLVTAEGEHAVMIVFSGDAQRGAVHRHVGIVFAEDYQAVIDAAFDAVRETTFVEFTEWLVRNFPLLGGHRPRRIEFTSPAGWAVRSRGLLLHFHAPSFARDSSLLTVLPAEPHGMDSIIKKLVHEDLLWSFALKHRAPDVPVESFFGGLRGTLTAVSGEIEGRPMHIQAVTPISATASDLKAMPKSIRRTY